MENKIYNDDVERIVNDPERQEAIAKSHHNRKMKKQRKMLINACVYAVISLAFGLMGCVGCMTPWIALLVCSIGGMCSQFCFGRWFENGKCWGWH